MIQGKKSSSSHRSQIDIIANILQVAVEGAKKTHIMYGCNLSFGQLQTYLDLLLDRGLLETISETGGAGNSAFFQTTTRGQSFLHVYQDLRGLLTA
ncbi:MAG: transcriptional regulator [Candidatus Bathyarchaeota archaeon]|nr:MAG: transcriptional regulator [Candidatus Bathyarchaeota archaeon]